MNEKQLYENQYAQKKLVNAKSFPRLRKVFRGCSPNREDLALRLLGEGDRLLDVGCGSGSLLFRAKDKFRELYGVDISDFRVAQAEKGTGDDASILERFHFSVLNVNDKLDFSDGFFDAVTSIAVIEHVFDPYFVVGEIHRVLRKGGTFIVQVPNIAYARYRIDLLMGRLPVTSSPHNWREIGWDGGHLHYFTVKRFCGLLEELGFRVLKVRGSGLCAKLRGLYPSLLTGDMCVKAEKR